MALWQYSFLVLPEDDGSYKNFNIFEAQNDIEDLFDDERIWLKNLTKVSTFDEIGNILPKGKSWSKDIILYGHEESNRFQIYKSKNNLVEAVSFRIDFTSDYEDILRGIIEFVQMKGFIILDEEYNKVENNAYAIKVLIENSQRIETYKKLSKLTRKNK